MNTLKSLNLKTSKQVSKKIKVVLTIWHYFYSVDPCKEKKVKGKK